MSDQRCSERKHVAEKGQRFCDCGLLMLGVTGAKNARVITIMDPLQRRVLTLTDTRDSGKYTP